MESYRALGAGITEFVCSGGQEVPPGDQPSEIDLVALKALATHLMDREASSLQGASRI